MFMQTPEEAYLDRVIVDLSLQLKAVSVQLNVAEKEAERLRAALERKQRPEAETIDGVIAWIKEDAERLAKVRAALGEKE